VQTTILLARSPAPCGAALRRSVAALALRFRDARVRLFSVSEDTPSARPPARFTALLLVERARGSWPAPQPVRDAPAGALDWLEGASGHRGTGRALREPPPAPAPGERGAGVVLVAAVVRAPALAHEEFDAYWRDSHGPIALRHHAGLVGYEQIPVTRSLTARALALDGVALLHFASEQDFHERFYDSEAGQEAIRADTRGFLDLARCEAAAMREIGVRS
jgi:uncharacterized protein (TIGR02118 family)